MTTKNNRPGLPRGSARILSSLVLLFVFGCIGIGPGCNILNDIGNAECAAAGYGGDEGDDGEGGAGGDDGAGGAQDQGAGGGAVAASAAATTGAGGAPGAGEGAGAGDNSSGAGAGRSVPHAARAVALAPRRIRRHHHKGGENIGTAQEADCPSPAEPAMAPMALPPQPPPPNWVGLDTGTLRDICVYNNINGAGSQTGIALNFTCGKAFEAWVLKTMGWLKNRWTKPIYSAERFAANNNGLPASVIPEQVLKQTTFTFHLGGVAVTWNEFPNSVFYEVKAVNAPLTLSTSKYQILGLLDVATSFPTVPAGAHAPPAVFFATTSNTTISPKAVTTATGLGVAVWQQTVQYDASQYNPSANKTNPPLRLGDTTCLNYPLLYPSVVYVIWPSAGSQNPLTWPTDQEQDGVVVPGDPDSPALVP